MRLALAETYSVLTRLPGDARLAPADAARAAECPLFSGPAVEQPAEPEAAGRAEPPRHRRWSVYDALVALAAKEHEVALATRDARAQGTYDAVGVKVIIVT